MTGPPHFPRCGVALVVIATGPDRVVTRALDAALQQQPPPAELIVVHRDDERSARARLRTELDDRPVHFVRSESSSPGAARNAGVRRSTAESFAIDDGSEVLPRYHLTHARARLAGAPAAAFAAAAGAALFGRIDCGGDRLEDLIDAAALVGGPWTVGPAMIRRQAFDDAGGYDESLPAFVEWDLLLTLVARGHTGVALAGSGVRHAEDDVRLREAMRVEHHLPATRRIVQKHHAIFRTAMPAAILERERVAKALFTYERALLERRREALARLNRRPPPRLTFADLRRTSPVSRNWGLERGLPVDRHYIHRFLAAHADDVRGHVLEMLDSHLTTTYGGDRVERADVLDIDPGNARATLVADLRDAEQLPAEAYDCFVLTQTLHLIDDMPAALRAAYRTLKPDGVLLATLPCASMVAVEYGGRGDHWRVTAAGARALFEQVFEPSDIEVRAHGNVLTITAFLYGLSCDEVSADEFACDDPAYPLLVTVRARKPVPPERRASVAARRPAGAVLLYHRVAEVPFDIDGLAVSPQRFRSQIEHLSRSWRVMPLRALVAACDTGEPPEGAVALTFDDGYLDNLEVVAPILAEFNLPATFFLIAERRGRERRFWWDVLEEVLLRSPDCPATIELRLGRERRTCRTAAMSDRRAAYADLHAMFKRLAPVVRDDLLAQLAGETGVRLASATQRPMAAEEVRRLLAYPLIEVGAHGMHHLALPQISSEACYREVSECRSALERLTGRAVTSFAYPFGDVSADAEAAVAAAGYEAAVTCETRAVRAREHRLRIPRLPACEESGAALTARLADVLGDVAVREGFEPSVGL